jgi:hypothetical protein
MAVPRGAETVVVATMGVAAMGAAVWVAVTQEMMVPEGDSAV